MVIVGFAAVVRSSNQVLLLTKLRGNCSIVVFWACGTILNMGRATLREMLAWTWVQCKLLLLVHNMRMAC